MNALTMEQIQQTAPSVFATQPYEGMSSRYRFIPTSGVIDAMRERGFVPVRATQSRVRIEGNKEFAKHVIRFRRLIDLDAPVDSEVVESVLENAHNGTSAYIWMFGLWRVRCGNGLVVASSTINEIHVRHSGSPTLAQEVAEASLDIMDEAPSVIRTVEDWKRIQLTEPQQIAYADSAKQLRDSSIDVDPRSLLNVRRFRDGGNDLWSTFNRVQENIIKGGNIGRNTKGNRVHTRSIKSVTEDLRVNRALWQLTEKMKELVTKN